MTYRFDVGAAVMCNFGENGWRLGKIIALNYREPNWPEDVVAPYQVLLDGDYSLIYVPEDDDRYCREATPEDVRILKRKDALAEMQSGILAADEPVNDIGPHRNLCCDNTAAAPIHTSYRRGRCFCCNDCPRDWSYAELYSEHYRCASRNNLPITRHDVNLGSLKPGSQVDMKPDESLLVRSGFLQAPTLVRLPPGLTFSDDGALCGEVAFDPHRGSFYAVDFVAVSTVEWQNEQVGLVRLEISFVVENNDPPEDFDASAFSRQQQEARTEAAQLLEALNTTWNLWERGQLGNRTTCDRMLDDLQRLRDVAETHPRLDNGKWWGHLGGFHMNVHKLLENTLFECELYLGYALTFGDDNVRYYAEQNLVGCYQKRLLEAARFMWYEGLELVMEEEWGAAAELFKQASAKKEGWGWAVNYGDIWLSEAVAVVLDGAHNGPPSNGEEPSWVEEAKRLVEKARARSEESGAFGGDGHPWVVEVETAMAGLSHEIVQGGDIKGWAERLQARTLFWCSQVLTGVFPFPPKCSDRLVEAAMLIDRLPSQSA